MNAAINICKINLVESKTLPTFVMPNRVKIFESAQYISYRSIKAGFLFDNSSSEVLHGLATFNRGLASFAIHTNQISGQQMPNRDKNLTADAQGASASTPRTRKSTPICAPSAQSTPLTPICRYSELKAHELQAELRKAKAATSVAKSATKAAALATQKHTFRVSLSCVYPGRVEGNISKIGIYHTDLYEAVSETEAVGIAVSMVKQRYAFLNIDLENIKSVKLSKSILQ